MELIQAAIRKKKSWSLCGCSTSYIYLFEALNLTVPPHGFHGMTLCVPGFPRRQV